MKGDRKLRKIMTKMKAFIDFTADALADAIKLTKWHVNHEVFRQKWKAGMQYDVNYI